MSKQWHWEPTVGYFPGMHVADAMADLADKGFVHVDQVAYVIAGHVDPFDEEQLYWSTHVFEPADRRQMGGSSGGQ